MKINIIINGRFHFFDLARELILKNHFVLLYTTLPKWYVMNWIGKKNAHIKTFVFIEILKRTLMKIGCYTIFWEKVQKKMFSLWTAEAIDDEADATIFFAGNGWHSKMLKNINRRNNLIIADEGSAHPITVNGLISDEVNKFRVSKDVEQRKPLDKETHAQYLDADIVVVPSSFVKRSLISQGINQDKIYVNPYGVDVNLFTPGLKESKINRPIRVMSCGLFSVQKGSHYFLKAAEHFSDHNNIEFIHVGGVSKELERTLNAYRRPNFIHHRPVPQNQLPNYYRNADIFVLSSLQDGFGMVVLQAMACGLALICSTNSCGEDVVEHGVNGFVYDPIKLHDLIDHIEELAENPDTLARFKVAARERAVAEYSWEAYGDRYLKIVENAKGLR